MTLRPVLISGEWMTPDSARESFTAFDPSAGTPLEDRYPVSDLAEVETALRAAREAKDELRGVGSEAIARFLEGYADAIEDGRGALVAMAHRETAYPVEPRLNSAELPRTTGQLRQAAAAARDGSWRRATIDTAADIRSMYEPLDGPVAVFGPNNFPFAFNSVAGGDFAAAVAAGNPVIAKANVSHPGVTRLLAELAAEASRAAGLPRAMVQLLYHLPAEVGLRFVSHPLLGATAFTGSRESGLRLKEAADRAGVPIYLEMSSINPVVILSGALEERGDELAAEFCASCTLGAGQFCTNPGFMVLLDDSRSREFLRSVAERLGSAAPGFLLGPRGPRGIDAAVRTMRGAGAEVVAGAHEVAGPGYRYANTLLRVSGAAFLQRSAELQTEAFGAVSLAVLARDAEELIQVVHRLGGNLTGTIYSHRGGADDELYGRIEPVLRGKVGRLLNDKMPTGVAVSPAMNHGGPYPATGHPGFTAVGIPAALLRFAALRCYDNVRSHRLPRELRDENPTGRMWRLVDGEWSRASL